MITYVFVAIGSFLAGIGISFFVMKMYLQRVQRLVIDQMKQTGMQAIFENASNGTQKDETTRPDGRPPDDIKDAVAGINEAFNKQYDDDYDDDSQELGDQEPDEPQPAKKPLNDQDLESIGKEGMDIIGEMLKQQQKDTGEPIKRKGSGKKKFPIKFKRDDTK